MTDLDDALGYPVPDDLDAPCEAPPDSTEADRMLYSLGRLARRLRDIETQAQGQVERVALWQQEESRKIKARYDWLEQGVTGWARAVHEAEPDRKTIRLPNGEVKVRPQQSLVTTHDPLLNLRQIAQSHPTWVRTVPERLEPEKNAIKAAVVASKVEAEIGPDAPEGYAVHHAVDKETSEIIPGVFLLVPVDKAVTVSPA